MIIELTCVEVGLLVVAWGLCGLLTFLVRRRKDPRWTSSSEVIPFILLGGAMLILEVFVGVMEGMGALGEGLGEWLHKINTKY